MSKSRHPNQFRVGRAASPNILTLGGNMPRAIAKTHANQLAAWLVATANEPEKFMEVLIDVYSEKHGEENIPGWLRTLCPNWQPWDPPELRKGGVVSEKIAAKQTEDARAAMSKRAKKAGPIKTASQAVRESSSGGGASRFLDGNGQPLDNEALLRQAEEAEAILKGEKKPRALQSENGNGNDGDSEEEPETEEEEEEDEDEDQPGEGRGQ